VSIGQDTILDINTVIIGPTKIGQHVTIAPNCVITASEIDDYSAVHANSILEHSHIGKYVNVGPFARLRLGTELADGVKIGNFVETKNAKFGVAAKANHLSYVGDASVGADTNIGAGVITCNYDGANKHQTNIGKDVFVGSDSQLVAPVTIADGATIGAGSTITGDVAAKQLAISRGRQRHIDNWQRPVKKS
jgi:bifunctional UDP-N-acetylglucosamine pyrophosphorylase/glucosamine-1-phosphate N-acetyltransferase